MLKVTNEYYHSAMLTLCMIWQSGFHDRVLGARVNLPHPNILLEERLILDAAIASLYLPLLKMLQDP